MSRVKDRDALIAQLSRELPDTISWYEVTALARKLLRAGTTLHRLAEAQCNGDYPYDNGERKVIPCSRCQSGCVPSKMSKDKLCPDCRTQDRVTKLLAEYGMTPIFNGDPRGAVFLVIPPSYEERNKGRDVHNLEGIYVS